MNNVLYVSDAYEAMCYKKAYPFLADARIMFPDETFAELRLGVIDVLYYTDSVNKYTLPYGKLLTTRPLSLKIHHTV